MKRFLMKGGRLFGGGKQAAKEPSASQEMGRWPAANADSRAESRNGRGVPSVIYGWKNWAVPRTVWSTSFLRIWRMPSIIGPNKDNNLAKKDNKFSRRRNVCSFFFNFAHFPTGSSFRRKPCLDGTGIPTAFSQNFENSGHCWKSKPGREQTAKE